MVLCGNVVFLVNSLNRAYRLTCATVDALIGLDIQHAVAFIDAINRAFFNAGPVLEVYTGKGDHVSHCRSKK